MNRSDMTNARATEVRRSLGMRLAITAVALAATGLAALCVVPWIHAWPFVLFEHFRLQYVMLGAVVVVAAAALRVRAYFDVALIATLGHLLPIAADLTTNRRVVPSDAVPIRVLVLNVHTSSSSFDRVKQLIADENPDVIGLIEVDDRWLAAVAPAVAGYTGRIEHPRPDNFGVALYARGKLVGSVAELGSRLPNVTADVTLGDARFHVILTHPIPPVSPAALAQQETQLDAVGELARKKMAPVLIMGDFNATPWSRPFRRLLDRSGLCDSRAGFGVQASFPASSSIMRIPIDHLLASCSVGVRERRIGTDVGSDHLPVIVDLAFRR
jgi:endonuclease/exonuclease/phosphatase (EEP) superfamily protein YafD